MKRTNKQLAQLFVSLAKDADEKKQTELANTLIKWLRDRGELKRLPDIYRAIDLVWKETYGIATITIETPYPLEKKLRTALEKQTNGAEIRERVVPELIAGARLRIDERIIDGSLLGALNQLTHQLHDAS